MVPVSHISLFVIIPKLSSEMQLQFVVPLSLLILKLSLQMKWKEKNKAQDFITVSDWG